jgi:hypothetical protein
VTPSIRPLQPTSGVGHNELTRHNRQRRLAAERQDLRPTSESLRPHRRHPMKSDFSGEYVRDRLASTLRADAAVQSAVLRIEHRESVFRYWATFVADGKTIEYSFERLTDGREVAVGENEVSRLYWEGDALVSEDRTGTPVPVHTISWRYELIDSGCRLRAIEQVKKADDTRIMSGNLSGSDRSARQRGSRAVTDDGLWPLREVPYGVQQTPS